MTHAMVTAKRVESLLIGSPLISHKKKKRKSKKYVYNYWGNDGEGIEDESEMGSPTEQEIGKN